MSLHGFQTVTITQTKATECFKQRCTQLAGMLREKDSVRLVTAVGMRCDSQDRALPRAPDTPGKRTCLELYLVLASWPTVEAMG